jgi:hypothetical protein
MRVASSSHGTTTKAKEAGRKWRNDLLDRLKVLLCASFRFDCVLNYAAEPASKSREIPVTTLLLRTMQY